MLNNNHDHSGLNKNNQPTKEQKNNSSKKKSSVKLSRKDSNETKKHVNALSDSTDNYNNPEKNK